MANYRRRRAAAEVAAVEEGSEELTAIRHRPEAARTFVLRFNSSHPFSEKSAVKNGAKGMSDMAG